MTHGPPGMLNMVTGVCGLAAMLWLYGVAWHQPMAESIAWARTTIADAIPSASTFTGGFAGGGGPIAGHGAGNGPRAPARAPDARRRRHRCRAPSRRPRRAPSRSTPTSRRCSPSAARNRGRCSVEGPRMLRAGNWRRAAELCRAWTDLDLGNAEP